MGACACTVEPTIIQAELFRGHIYYEYHYNLRDGRSLVALWQFYPAAICCFLCRGAFLLLVTPAALTNCYLLLLIVEQCFSIDC